MRIFRSMRDEVTGCNDSIKEYVMGAACSTHARDEKHVHNFCRNLSDHLAGLSLERIILRNRKETMCEIFDWIHMD
jgi:hypothetical protein